MRIVLPPFDKCNGHIVDVGQITTHPFSPFVGIGGMFTVTTAKFDKYATGNVMRRSIWPAMPVPWHEALFFYAAKVVDDRIVCQLAARRVRIGVVFFGYVVHWTMAVILK